MFNFQINPKLIHWDSEDTYIFVNPHLSKAEQMLIKVNEIPLVHKGLIWVGSSGTTAESSFKLIGLKKSAFLGSAKAVCKRLKITSDDIWLSILPRFHVAGLAVEARSYVSGCKINALNSVKFNAKDFLQILDQYKVTVTSIVPTQAFEIVRHKLKAPSSLNFLYVGGAQLSSELHSQLVALGWPVIITYGMTEAASSVATSLLKDKLSDKLPKMYLLDHIQAQSSVDQEFKLKSESLAQIEITFHENKPTQVKQFNNSEYRVTQDFLEVNSSDRSISFIARKNQQVKISGELVNVNQLHNSFEDFKLSKKQLFISKIKSGRHSKYGCQVELYVEGLNDVRAVENLASDFNQALPKYQKIKTIFFVNQLKRSSISKII